MIRTANNTTSPIDGANVLLSKAGISRLSRDQDEVVGILLIVIGVTAICFNGFVLVVGLFKRSLVVPHDYYIFNLAFFDSIMPLFGYPLSAYSSFSHQWSLGHAACVYYGFMGFLTGLVAVGTLAVLSFVRYLKVCHPFGAGLLVKKRMVFVSLIFIYLYSLFWTSLPLFGWGKYGLEPAKISCSIKWEDRDAGSMSYIISITIFCFIIPLIVMIYAYGRITYDTMSSRRNLTQTSTATQNVVNADTHMTKVSLTMCVVYVLAWFPYTVVSLMAASGSCIPMLYSVLPALFAKSSNALNPIVFFFMNKKFQKVVFKMFRRRPQGNAPYDGHQGTETFEMEAIRDGSVRNLRLLNKVTPETELKEQAFGQISSGSSCHTKQLLPLSDGCASTDSEGTPSNRFRLKKSTGGTSNTPTNTSNTSKQYDSLKSFMCVGERASTFQNQQTAITSIHI